MVSIGPKNNFVKPAVAPKPPVAQEPPAAPTGGPQKAMKSYSCGGGTLYCGSWFGKNGKENFYGPIGSTWSMY